MAKLDLDLNVDAPRKVVGVLRDAAQAYSEAAVELESAWQDKNAGKVWNKIAAELYRAADRVATACDKAGVR